MHRPAPGRYVTVTTVGEPFQAFVPAPLPPDPPIVWSAAVRAVTRTACFFARRAFRGAL